MDDNLLLFLLDYEYDHPECTEIRVLLSALQAEPPSLHESIFRSFLMSCGALCQAFTEYCQEDHGIRYRVFRRIPPHLVAKQQSSQSNDHMRLWADTLRSLPRFTIPLKKDYAELLQNANRVWEEKVCGNEHILKILKRHALEYHKTGKTAPILLVGPPGCGKTLIGNVYASILQLPFVFISSPGASFHRGLAGSPSLYTNAGVGAIADAMISCKCGNPCICIDEIDKASHGHSGTPSFPNELLTALDTSNTRFFDNYLEMAIDTCHIPYIFTANDISPIPQPLLDRMEVVQLDAPTRDTLVTIARGHTLPNLLRIYDSQGIQIEENTIETLVDALWRNGNRSCRPYERALKQLISDAYLQQVETGQTVVISAYDARHTAKQFCAAEDSGRPIGFLTA